jgi:hypothetical protein
MRLNKVTIYARITTVGYGQYTCITKTEKCTDCTHLPLEGTGVELRCFLGRVHNTTDSYISTPYFCLIYGTYVVTIYAYCVYICTYALNLRPEYSTRALVQRLELQFLIQPG